MQCLPGRIFRKCRRIFFEPRQRLESREQLQRNARPGQSRSGGVCERAVFRKFSWIGRCEKKSNGRAH
jgi:hypothetical protein